MNSFIQSSRKLRKVLVVDDEPINRELLQAILALNYDVDAAENGSIAMEKLRTAEEPYSLILLDLLMPQKSEFQVLEECKSDKTLKKIPIIVMTSEKSAEVRSIRLGASDFIPKPYRMPEVILARCERIVELSEERALIRSIEKDKLTDLYKRDFFFAYLSRLPKDSRTPIDAFAVKIDGCHHLSDSRGTHSKDVVIKKAAQFLLKEFPENRGLACRADETVFFVCGRHINDPAAAFENIQRELDALSAGVRIRAGIYSRVNKAEPCELWFDCAAAACGSIMDNSQITAFFK